MILAIILIVIIFSSISELVDCQTYFENKDLSKGSLKYLSDVDRKGQYTRKMNESGRSASQLDRGESESPALNTFLENVLKAQNELKWIDQAARTIDHGHTTASSPTKNNFEENSPRSSYVEALPMEVDFNYRGSFRDKRSFDDNSGASWPFQKKKYTYERNYSTPVRIYSDIDMTGMTLKRNVGRIDFDDAPGPPAPAAGYIEKYERRASSEKKDPPTLESLKKTLMELKTSLTASKRDEQNSNSPIKKARGSYGREKIERNENRFLQKNKINYPGYIHGPELEERYFGNERSPGSYERKRQRREYFGEKDSFFDRYQSSDQFAIADGNSSQLFSKDANAVNDQKRKGLEEIKRNNGNVSIESSEHPSFISSDEKSKERHRGGSIDLKIEKDELGRVSKPGSQILDSTESKQKEQSSGSKEEKDDLEGNSSRNFGSTGSSSVFVIPTANAYKLDRLPDNNDQKVGEDGKRIGEPIQRDRLIKVPEVEERIRQNSDTKEVERTEPEEQERKLSRPIVIDARRNDERTGFDVIENKSGDSMTSNDIPGEMPKDLKYENAGGNGAVCGPAPTVLSKSLDVRKELLMDKGNQGDQFVSSCLKIKVQKLEIDPSKNTEERHRNDPLRINEMKFNENHKFYDKSNEPPVKNTDDENNVNNDNLMNSDVRSNTNYKNKNIGEYEEINKGNSTGAESIETHSKFERPNLTLDEIISKQLNKNKDNLVKILETERSLSKDFNKEPKFQNNRESIAKPSTEEHKADWSENLRKIHEELIHPDDDERSLQDNYMDQENLGERDQEIPFDVSIHNLHNLQNTAKNNMEENFIYKKRYNNPDQDLSGRSIFDDRRSRLILDADTSAFENYQKDLRKKRSNKELYNYMKARRHPMATIEYYDYDEAQEQDENVPADLNEHQRNERERNFINSNIANQEGSEICGDPILGKKKNEHAEHQMKNEKEKEKFKNNPPKQEYITDVGEAVQNKTSQNDQKSSLNAMLKEGGPGDAYQGEDTTRNNRKNSANDYKNILRLISDDQDRSPNRLERSRESEYRSMDQDNDFRVIQNDDVLDDEPLEYVLTFDEKFEPNDVKMRMILEDARPTQFLYTDKELEALQDLSDDYEDNRLDDQYKDVSQKQVNNMDSSYEELQKVYDWTNDEIKDKTRLKGDQRMKYQFDDDPSFVPSENSKFVAPNLPKSTSFKTSGSDYYALKMTDDMFKGGSEQSNPSDKKTGGKIESKTIKPNKNMSPENDVSSKENKRLDQLDSRILRKNTKNDKNDDYAKYRKQSNFGSKDLHESFVEPLDWLDDFDNDIRVRLGRGLKSMYNQNKVNDASENIQDFENSSLLFLFPNQTLETNDKDQKLNLRGKYRNFSRIAQREETSKVGIPSDINFYRAKRSLPFHTYYDDNDNWHRHPLYDRPSKHQQIVEDNFLSPKDYHDINYNYLDPKRHHFLKSKIKRRKNYPTNKFNEFYEPSYKKNVRKYHMPSDAARSFWEDEPRRFSSNSFFTDDRIRRYRDENDQKNDQTTEIPDKKITMLLESDDTEDEYQMNLAFHGELAGQIVDQIFAQVQDNEALKSTLGPGLYRKHKPGKLTDENGTQPDETNNTETTMTKVVKLLDGLVLNKVQKKTCASLPQEMKDFLQWMVGVDHEEETTTETSRTPPTSDEGTSNKTEEYSFLFHKDLNNRENIELYKKIRVMQNLINEYNSLTEREKIKVETVRDYLVRQLDRLSEYIEAREKANAESVSSRIGPTRDKIRYISQYPNLALRTINHATKNSLNPNDLNTGKFRDPRYDRFHSQYYNDLTDPYHVKYRKPRSLEKFPKRHRRKNKKHRSKKHRRRRKHRKHHKQKHSAPTSDSEDSDNLFHSFENDRYKRYKRTDLYEIANNSTRNSIEADASPNFSKNNSCDHCSQTDNNNVFNNKLSIEDKLKIIEEKINVYPDGKNNSISKRRDEKSSEKIIASIDLSSDGRSDTNERNVKLNSSNNGKTTEECALKNNCLKIDLLTQIKKEQNILLTGGSPNNETKNIKEENRGNYIAKNQYEEKKAIILSGNAKTSAVSEEKLLEENNSKFRESDNNPEIELKNLRYQEHNKLMNYKIGNGNLASHQIFYSPKYVAPMRRSYYRRKLRNGNKKRRGRRREVFDYDRNYLYPASRHGYKYYDTLNNFPSPRSDPVISRRDGDINRYPIFFENEPYRQETEHFNPIPLPNQGRRGKSNLYANSTRTNLKNNFNDDKYSKRQRMNIDKSRKIEDQISGFESPLIVSLNTL